MKNYKIFLSILLFVLFLNSNSQDKNEVYVFSYFMGNGEDGLHLAYSTNGLKWEALKDNKSFLTPAVGVDKLMRDPCIIAGPDGKFHMVWTVSWNENGIGYASSKDLINWSEQLYIPVMEHEPTQKTAGRRRFFTMKNRSNTSFSGQPPFPGVFQKLKKPATINTITACIMQPLPILKLSAKQHFFTTRVLM
jgi:hypothetical protein